MPVWAFIFRNLVKFSKIFTFLVPYPIPGLKVHCSMPNFTHNGAMCRPCGAKHQNHPMSNLITCTCTARNAASNPYHIIIATLCLLLSKL